MRLNDPLITFFEFENNEYHINLAFDIVLDVYDVLADTELYTIEKLSICLDLLLGEREFENENIADLWKYIYSNFIEIGNVQKPRYDVAGNLLPAKHNKQYIDIEKDANYIFASFLQAYKINLLNEQGGLSWVEFHALLQALPEDTILQKIVSIRRWKPSKHESREYKSHMKKLQKQYFLDSNDEYSLFDG